MGDCSVVILPDHSSRTRPALVAGLVEAGLTVHDIEVAAQSPAPISVRVCAAVRAAAPEPPLLFVATTRSLHLLPAVALAQRTAHQLTVGYAIVADDGDASVQDPSGESWPDAPVCLVSAGGDMAGSRAPVLGHAALRGWQVIEAGGGEEVAAAIAHLARNLAP